MVCNERGYCRGYDTCVCLMGYRGRECEFEIKSDIFFGGVVILVTLSGVSVFALMVLIAILYRRKNVTSGGDEIKWSELEEDGNEEESMLNGN
jgi:hypothetical protein